MTKKTNYETKQLDLRLARRNVRIGYSYRGTHGLCADYCAFFDEPDITVSVTQSEIEAARAADNTTQPVLLPQGVAMAVDGSCYESTIILRKIADAMAAYDTILMHGAVVSLDGWAYMFTAPSGVGKTTRLMRWLEEYPDSQVINGDKPFVRIDGDRAMACGSPWAGKERMSTNMEAPLRAIFLLERTGDREPDSIRPVSCREAFAALLRQTHRPEDPMQMCQMLRLLAELADRVKLYRLRTAPTRTGVRLAYETARPK